MDDYCTDNSVERDGKPGSAVRVLFIAVLLLAALVRLYDLNNCPPGLQIDEASISVTAHILATTGRDEKGATWPLYPQSTWNPKHPVYLYPQALAVRVFGMNAFSARLPSALFGLLCVAATFFLALELAGRGWVALAAMLLVAVSPWHVHLSRYGVEVVALPALFAWALFCLLKGVRGRPWYLLAGAFLCGLTFYAYPVSLLFVPLFLAGFAVIFRKSLLKNLLWTVFSVLLVGAMFFPVATGSFCDTDMDSYFRYSSITGERFHMQARTHLMKKGDALSRWIADRATARTVYGFVTNYIGYFSPQYLFVRGDNVTITHGTERHGVMLAVCLPLLIVGLWQLLQKPHGENLLLLWWLVLFPVGASLMAWGHQHALRSAVAIPVLQIICALGIFKLLQWVVPLIPGMKWIPVTIIVLSIVGNAALFFHYYFKKYPQTSQDFYNAGMEQGVKYLNQEKAGVRSVIVSDSIPHVYAYVMFYAHPNKENIVWNAETGDMDVKATLQKMGFQLCDIRRCIESAPKPALVLARPAQLPDGVYRKRNAPGLFSLKKIKTFGYSDMPPNIAVSHVQNISDSH